MPRLIGSLDRAVSVSRPAWLWIGQLAVVVLGAHLAADRLDDHLLTWLMAAPITWPDPEAPLLAATWSSVALELTVVAFAVATLFRASRARVEDLRGWWDRRSVWAWVAPLFWLPTAATGAWVAGMAVEDLVAPWVAEAATPLAWVAAALVAWRLGWTGLVRVVRGTPTPRRRLEGLAFAAPALIVAALALRHGLPLWGWLA